MFREGLTLKGEVTYTPRLLSLDLQGSLGLLPQCGELYGRCNNSDSKPIIASTDPVTKLINYNHIPTIQQAVLTDEILNKKMPLKKASNTKQ